MSLTDYTDYVSDPVSENLDHVTVQIQISTLMLDRVQSVCLKLGIDPDQYFRYVLFRTLEKHESLQFQ